MVVEVGMNRQVAAIADLVETAAHEIGVGDQALDAGDVLHQRDERPRVEDVEQGADPVGREVRLDLALQPFLAAVVGWAGLGLRVLKLGDAPVDDRARQEVVDDDVGKGIGGSERGVQLLAPPAQGRRIHLSGRGIHLDQERHRRPPKVGRATRHPSPSRRPSGYPA